MVMWIVLITLTLTLMVIAVVVIYFFVSVPLSPVILLPYKSSQLL